MKINKYLLDYISKEHFCKPFDKLEKISERRKVEFLALNKYHLGVHVEKSRR